jgi:peptidoglycan/xylan/chitin deacetylase (PgdA/CDA1 family)
MRLGKHETWLACGLVSLALVAVGAGIDRLAGTRFIFGIAATVLAVVYLTATFAVSLPIFGRAALGRPLDAGFALTFDDGPDPRHTPAISRLLGARGHRATFFLLGEHARRYPELVAQLAADGHELANHGDDHRLLALSLPSTVREQLTVAQEAITAAAGHGPARLFRAPHGVRSPWLRRTAARSGYRLCGWNGRIRDTANPGVETIVARVTSELRPGAVILLHDGDGSGRGALRSQTVQALPAILDEAERRGLRSVWFSTLLS